MKTVNGTLMLNARLRNGMTRLYIAGRLSTAQRRDPSTRHSDRIGRHSLVQKRTKPKPVKVLNPRYAGATPDMVGRALMKHEPNPVTQEKRKPKTRQDSFQSRIYNSISKILMGSFVDSVDLSPTHMGPNALIKEID